MKRLLLLASLLNILLPTTPSFAQSANGHLARAETAFDRQEYAVALQWLQSMPGLVTLIPDLSPIGKNERAAIHLDLATCHLALGDTLRAFLNVEHAYSLNSRLKMGHFESGRLRRFRQGLKQDRLLPGQNQPSRVEAAMKSALIPGLGQFHLKRPERGAFFLGATATAGLLYLRNRPPEDPNSVPFGEVKKDNSKVYLAVLVGIYSFNVLDCLVVGSNGVSLQVNFP